MIPDSTNNYYLNQNRLNEQTKVINEVKAIKAKRELLPIDSAHTTMSPNTLVMVKNVKDKLETRMHRLHNIHYECITITKNGDLLSEDNEEWNITGAYDNKIVIKNKLTNESIYTSENESHKGRIRSLCLKGEQFFSASEDTTLKAWNIKTGECLKTFNGHTKMVGCFCTEGNLLISGSWDKTIKIWDIESGNCLKSIPNQDEVLSIAVCGKYIIAGSCDGMIRIWDMESEECIRKFQAHGDFVNAILIHNGFIISGSRDKKIKIWDFTGICLNTLKGHTHNLVKLEMQNDMLISKSIFGYECITWKLKDQI